MSTRCNVVIKKNEKFVTLYHHHDGYPEGVGVDLAQYFAEILSDDSLAKKVLKTPNALAKWLCDEDRDDEYRTFGNCIKLAGDIEYLYVIDMEDKTITCYKVKGWDMDYEDIINSDERFKIYTTNFDTSVDETVTLIDAKNDDFFDD